MSRRLSQHSLRRARLELLRCLVRRELTLLSVELQSADEDRVLRSARRVFVVIDELDRLGTDARA